MGTRNNTSKYMQGNALGHSMTSGLGRSFRLGGRLGVIAVLISFALTLGVAPMQAYADDTTGNTLPEGMSYDTKVERGPDPSGETQTTLRDGTKIPNGGTDATQSVRQPDSGTARNFAAGLPLANIYIKEKFENEPQVRYENPCMKSVKGDRNIFYYYDTTLAGAQAIYGQQINTLDGPLISFTYKDAATLPNGSYANVKVTVSNAKLLLDGDITDKYNGYINLLMTPNYGDDINSVKLCPFTSDTPDVEKVGNYAREGTYKDAGLVVDINYQIVDDSGQPIAGTFFYANSDIRFSKYRNNPRPSDNLIIAEPIAYALADDFDSQGIDFDYFADSQIINKSDMASDYAYVKSNDTGGSIYDKYYFPKITETENNGKIRFTAQLYDNGSNFMARGQYDTGFVTLAKGGSSGFTTTMVYYLGYIKSTARGLPTIFMGSTGHIWYRYTMKSGAGGTIQTTSEGNYDKKLTDGGEILGPEKSDETYGFAVAEGKTVTYTLTPKTGYKINSVKLNGEDFTFNGFNLDDGKKAGLAWNMKKGDSATLSTKAGQTATLTYEEDGTYSLVIPYAEADEDVVVDWRKTTADILVSKIWDDKDDKDGIRKYTYDTKGPWPRLMLQWSTDGGKTWQDASIESDYLNDPDKYSYLRAVPLGWDAEDEFKYKDGTYEIDARWLKEKEEDRPIYTWPFLPVYTYDANGNVDRPILYRILEGSLDDLKEIDFDGRSPALTGYEEPEYSPGQVFTLTSEETKTKDGWPIYRDSSNNKDYILKNGKYYEVTNWVAADDPADTQPDPDNLHAVTEHDKKIIDGQTVVRNPLNDREYIANGTEYYEVVYDVASSEVAFDTSTYSTDKSVNPDYDHTDPNTPDVRTFSEVTLNSYATADTAVVTFNADVMNKHTPTNVYVDVQKEWNDGDLFGQETTETDGNKYERPDIIFTLHGTIVDNSGKTSDVDLDPADKSTTDRTITLSPTETGAKDDDESADGSAYKIDDYNFGVIFRNLPQYQDGRLIEYTVTESFDKADAWTATGGTITAVKSGDTTTGYTLSELTEVNEDGEHKGYSGSFVNTPVVDDKYEKLPVTIVKQDANDPNSKLEGATFTVYTNPTDKVEPETSFYKQIDGLTVWRYSWNNNVQFVLKDGKYYRVLSDGSIAANPVDPQPNAANLTKVINDVDAPVDEIHVVTDADGSATINFRQTGTYYVVETKAPEGYEVDTTVYKFVVDKELKTVTLEESDDDHETHWWQRLMDLIFGDGTNEEDNWDQDENKRGGTLTVKDEPIKANILVRKIWEDANDQDGLRPSEDEDEDEDEDKDTMPQVWLQRQVNTFSYGGTAYATYAKAVAAAKADGNSESAVVTKAGEWENVDLDTWEKRDISDTDGIIVENPEDHFTWENLPAYENGQPIKYRVVEADGKDATEYVITGDALTAYSYNAQTVPIADPSTGEKKSEKEFYLLEDGTDVTAKNRTVNVTNTHTPQTISLNASKHWNDESNDEQERPTNATLSLYKLLDGVETYVADIPLDGVANTVSDAVKELEPTDNGNTWNGEVGKLPAYENGQAITYVLRESSVPTHYSDTYTVSYTKTDDTSGDASGTSAINAASIKRSFKTEDETTTETTSASITVTNTINMEIPVQKTWVDGANANVTYTLFRTTKAEAELEDSKYKQVDSTIDSSKKVTTWSPYAADGTTLVDGWEQVSAAGEVTIGSYHFKTVGATDGGDTYGDSPDETIAFPVRVPEYAPDGTKYLYRILESPAGSANFEADYATDGRKVTNTNALTGTVYANVNVVKELQGRNWVNLGKDNADHFYFNIEAVGGKFVTGNGVDHNDNDAVAKADVPLPTDGDPATTGDSVGQANTGTAKVGAIGRNVPFNPIAFNTANTKMGNGETVEYEYKVYESDANGNRITQQTIAGVTYEGSTSGGTFTSTEHKLRVRVSRDASGVFAAPEIFWDDSTTASAVPVFTNTYEASTELHGLIVKQVNGREITGTDSFVFKVSNLSGGVMRLGEDDAASLDPREADAATITQNAGSKVAVDAEASGKAFKPEAGNGGNYRAIRTSTATIIKSSDLAQVTSDGKATDTFIYEFYEHSSSASDKDDLTLDAGKVYLKAVITDNQDGTLDVKTSYWRDATCTKDEVDARVLVYAADDGTHKAGELAPSGADPQEAAYTYVPAALFVNNETLDVLVKKVWQDGPATEDVTLHLKRHLFALTEEGRLDGTGDGNGAAYVEIQESAWVADGHDADSFWEAVGLVYTAPRGDFLNADGTPRHDSVFTSDSSKTYTDIEGFNKDLPMYVIKADADGNPVTYRAVYKLVEDDTSDAYETTYGNQVFINSSSGTLSVTNKVVATNTANIAAVKQLLGRNWAANDDFAFTLTPTGKATYGDDGEINGTDTTDETIAKIPVPKTDAERDSSTTGQVATTHAKQDTDTYPAVDPNGGLERLARFGAITYTVDDLVYDEKDGHMQGDFFYEMRETIPEGAQAYDKTSGEKVEGTTYSDSTSDDDRKAYTWKQNGITYDGSVHTVHVKVRENRTDTLVVQVAYDEETPGDISTGTQFTPVYTNRYSAEATATVTIDKHIMGRNWKADDTFDFIMNSVGGAPFRDADASDFPAKADDDGTDEKVQAALEGGKAAHTERFAHIKRMTIDAGNVGTSNAQSMAMPKLAFTYSDLNLTVAEDDALYYGNVEAAANKVPAGTAYGQFVYAIEETKYKNITPDVADLDIDTDTEYARITVIDRGEGTLDTYVEIFEDRYCTVERYAPGSDGSASTTPATAVTFVNQLKRDLTVTKAWADPAIGDVILRLQWSTDGAHWYNVDGTTWFPNVEGTKTIAKDANGADLRVTWTGLPAYANISEHDDQTGRTADDKDLNDSWLYYQVVEDRATNVTTRYSETPYVQGDTPSTKVTVNGEETNKYSTDPFHTGAEKDDAGNWVTERVKNLYVTNFPDDFEDAVTFGVVKQYIGKVWESETFTFKAEPVKAKLGDDEDYTNEGAEVGGAAYHMPRMQNNTATASAETPEVSVNEHAANFGSLTIKQSDLARVTADGDPDKGKDRGEFIYKITEVAPDGAVEITEDGKAYRLATDSKGNKIKYTTEEHTVKIVAVSDGTKITFTVSYDDRETGQFVPVYTNYAMVPTPIEGTKTWVGGPATEHENGTVTLSDGNDAVTDATDKLGLVLQRSSTKASSTTQTVATDDAGRDLVIVWAKQTEEQTGTYTSYEPTADTAVNDAKTYYSDEDDIGEYTAVTPAGGEDPSAEGWYEQVETPMYATKFAKQETGDATYTVMAKDENGSFVDPMLPLVDSEGYAYTYSIAEPTAPIGYKATATGMDVTNTYDKKGSLKVTKAWDDANNSSGLRPADGKVTVHLFKYVPDTSEGAADGAKKLVQVQVEEKEISTGTGNTGSVTFEGLPVYEGGAKIDYVVVEESVAGYTTTYSLNGTDYAAEGSDSLKFQLDGNTDAEAQNVDVKNELVPETTKVEVTKVWDDDSDRDGKRPTSINIQLFEYTWNATAKKYEKNATAVATLPLNGEADDAATGSAIKVQEATAWAGEFTNLPATKNGKTVIYAVAEQTDPVNADYKNAVVTGNQVDGFTVTNTHVPETIDIPVEKAWADDVEAYRPDHVQVRLLADGTATGDVLTLTKEGNFKGTFAGLPKYRATATRKTDPKTAAEQIVYTVEEASVPEGYAATVTNEGTAAAPSYKVTNTFSNLTASTELKVTKELANHAIDADHKFEFVLFGGPEDKTDGLDANKTFEGATTTAALDAGTNKATEVVSLGTINFTRNDLKKLDGTFATSRTFTYLVYEKAGNVDGVVYDTAPRTVTATLTYTAATETADEKLEVAWSPAMDGTGVTFSNTYDPSVVTSAPYAGIKVIDDKDNKGRTPKDGEFAFKLKGTAAGSKDASGTQMVALNDAQGKVTFGSIAFTEAGTYVYEVSEVKGADGTIAKWDADENGTRTLTATVAYNANRELAVTWSGTGTGVDNTAKTITFTNETKQTTTDKPVRVTWVNDTDYDDTVGMGGDPANTSADRPSKVTVTLQANLPTGKYVVDGVDGTFDSKDAAISAAEAAGKTADDVKPEKKLVDVADPDDPAKSWSVELSSANAANGDPDNWFSDAFKNLPAYDENGDPIAYSVAQTKVEKADGTTKEGTKANGLTSPVSPVGYKSLPIAINAADTLATILNTYETTAITGTKVWVDPEGTPHNNSADLKLQVERSADGGSTWTVLNPATDYHIDWSTTSTKDDTFKVAGLAKYVDADAAEKVEYRYKVTENPVPSGYTAAYKSTVDGQEKTDGTVGSDGKITITNTINQAYVEVPVEKVWVGEATDDVTISLKASGTEVATHAIAKIATGDALKYTFTKKGVDNPEAGEKLPKYKFENGTCTVIEYTVAETPDGTAAGAKFTSSISGNAADGFTITNTNTSPVVRPVDPEPTTSISATKTWVDTNGGSEELHTDVVLHLYGKVDGGIVYDAGAKTIAKDSTDAVTWKNLPKKSGGKDIKWSVMEEAVFGYTASYSPAEAESGTIAVTNTYTEPVSTVKVTKTWNDGNDVDGKRPETIYYQLWKKVGTDNPVAVGDPVEAIKDATGTGAGQNANWGYTWTNLPVVEEVKDGTENQTTYTSTTKQRQVTRVFIIDDTDTTLYAWLVGETTYYAAADKSGTWYTADGDVVNNTDDAATGYVDTSNATAVQEDYEETAETTVEVDKMVEKPIYYSVTEVLENDGENKPYGAGKDLKSLGYTASVSTTETPGEYRAINTREQDTQTLTITKKWNDSNNAEGVRPDHIEIVLKADDAEIRRDVMTGDMSGDTWTIELTDLPVNKLVDGASTAIVYTVDEADVPAGYGKSLDGLTLTNTYTTATPITIKIVKKWEGEAGDTSARTALTFHLIQVVDGAFKEVGTAQTLEVDADATEQTLTWPGTWPVVVGGKKATYTVEEDAIEGYTSEKAEDGQWDADNATLTITWTNTKIADEPTPGPVEESRPKVSYIDPKAADGSMIMSATKFDSQTAADAEAESLAGKPADPSHAGYNFVGWTVNKDKFGDYVVVAKYNEVLTQALVYFDPQDNTSETEEFTPSHSGLQFLEWVEMMDNNGTVLGYVAKYASDCANPAPSGGSSSTAPSATAVPPKATTPVPTGTSASGTPVKGTPKTADEAPVVLLAGILVISVACMLAANRRQQRVAPVAEQVSKRIR